MRANQANTLSRTLVSRRGALRGLSGAEVATALALGVPGLAATTAAVSQPQVEPQADTWKTWILNSGDQMRPAAPPDAAATAAEPMAPGEEVVLSPGDWVVESGMVHSARAVGDEAAIVVFSGLAEAGQPLTTCVA
jgi:hypothetical protein